MPTNAIQRPNFYPGQYLSAADLVAAQDYQREQDRRHRLSSHTWGIAAGLELEEVPRPGDSTAADVYIRPGYAVDGYGQTIVLLESYQLRPATFTQFTPPPNTSFIWVPIWLYYCERRSDPPPASFARCDGADQTRVRESFAVLVGQRPSAELIQAVEVDGRTLKATDMADASVPHQKFLSVAESRPWLIPLGCVRWSGTKFLKSESEDERAQTRKDRRYVGVVAEDVLAPAGRLRIRSRLAPAHVANETDHLAAVEGSLRVDGLFTASKDATVLGKLGVGTANPLVKLDIAGAVLATNLLATSDAKFKVNVKPLEPVLEKLQRIRGVSFEATDAYKAKGGTATGKQLGVIAQEVEAAFPELVTTLGVEADKAVDYGQLTAVLLEAIKELQVQVRTLTDQVGKLESSGSGREPTK